MPSLEKLDTILSMEAIEKPVVGQIWSMDHHLLISDLELRFLRPQIPHWCLVFHCQESSPSNPLQL